MLSKFPILHVPQLVLTDIINQIELGDLISLSLCSKNMFLLIQFHRTNMKDMDLGVSCVTKDDYKISCYRRIGGKMTITPFLSVSDVEYPYPDMVAKILDSEVKVINERITVFVDRKDGYLRTFCLDRVAGIQEMTRYVAKLLKKTIEVVALDENSFWLLDWIKTVQAGLHIAVAVEFPNNEQYEHVAEKCEATALMLLAKPPPSFQYRKNFLERKYLVVKHGFWITLDHLLNLRTSYVDINESKLTAADLNAFLKHWLRDGSPELKFLRVNFDGNPVRVLDGLREKMVFIQKPRKFSVNMFFGDSIMFGAGTESIEIRQDNGKRAMIGHFLEPKMFLMAVGDDFIETTNGE